MLLASLVSVVLLSTPASSVAPAADQAKPAPAQAKPASAARTVEITGGDDMKYSVTSIAAKPGETLHIKLVSKGTLPKIAMAHNFVLLKLDRQAAGFRERGCYGSRDRFHPAGHEGSGAGRDDARWTG